MELVLNKAESEAALMEWVATTWGKNTFKSVVIDTSYSDLRAVKFSSEAADE